MRRVLAYFLLGAFLSPGFLQVGQAGDNLIFSNPRLPMRIYPAFKKIKSEDSFNADAFEFEAGASDLDSVFLAFGVETRYRRDCSSAKKTLLCNFMRSSLHMGADIAWSEDHDDRLEVVLVPVQYLIRSFSHLGPDNEIAPGSAYLDVGGRVEYLRDLGIDVENRIVAELAAGVNLGDQVQLYPGFRWFGSAHVFVGGGVTDLEQLQTEGMLTYGLDTKIGVAIDFEKGSLILSDSKKLESDRSPWGELKRGSLLTSKTELKYLRNVCGKKEKGVCRKAAKLTYGGGMRYQAISSGFETEVAGNEIDVERDERRVLFFLELNHF